jgi:hypothetical protein
MASAFSHAFVATALGSTYARHHMTWYFWVASLQGLRDGQLVPLAAIGLILVHHWTMGTLAHIVLKVH